MYFADFHGEKINANHSILTANTCLHITKNKKL